jgi:hypothetical protein
MENSANNFLFEGYIPLNDRKKIRELTDELPFSIPFANKVTNDGQVRVKFT